MGFSTRADDATLVLGTRAGAHEAFEVLIQRWLARALDTAAFILADHDDAAAAAADGFEQAWRRREDLEPPSAFGPALIRATRRAALGRVTAGAPPLDHVPPASAVAARDGLTWEEELAAQSKPGDAMATPELAEIVRSAGVAVDPADRSLLLAHVRDDVSVASLAEDTGLTTDETDQLLFRVRARYRAAIEARILWRSGHPVCPELADVVEDAPFDVELATGIIDHAEACTACTQAKRLQMTPAALLAALPAADAGEDADTIVHDRLSAAGFTGTSIRSAHGLGRMFGRTEGPPERPRRRSHLALWGLGCAAALVLVLVLLAIHPWSSTAKRNVGVLGGASDGSTVRGAIDSRTTAAPSTAAKPTATQRSTTTSVATTTSHPPHVTSVPPAPVAPPPPSNLKRPSVTSASAGYVGPCTGGSGSLLRVAWATRDATTVSVRPTPVDPGPFPGSGTTHVCVPSLPATVTLTATGPGGATLQSLQVVGPPTTTSTTSTTTTTTVLGLNSEPVPGQ